MLSKLLEIILTVFVLWWYAGLLYRGYCNIKYKVKRKKARKAKWKENGSQVDMKLTSKNI